MKTKLSVGVIGLGHWGPNHLRVFSNMPDVQVVAVADQDRARLTRHSAFGVRLYSGHRDLLADRDVEAVVIATPTTTHPEIVACALEQGKHVLCEKPLCIRPSDGDRLVAAAHARGLVLMVGHIFLFNPGLVKVKELLDAGEIGEPRYLSAVRTNLGPVRSDVNSAYDLASHDISVFNWLLGAEPVEARAMGAAFLQPGIEDVVTIALRYPSNVLGTIQCSWLDPKKVRQLTLVGSKRMITWDDLAMSNPVAIYEKSIETNREITDYGEFLRLSMLDGDVRLPKIATAEPLKLQAASFLAAVRGGGPFLSDGPFALGVVKTLDLVNRALRQPPAASSP